MWKNIFGNYVSLNKQPLFSIFRKKITSDKIKFMRPGTGIKAKDLRLVINKKAKRDLNTNDFLNWKHIVK